MHLNKSQLVLNLGAVLEYFDYLIFALLAKFIIGALVPGVGHTVIVNFLFFSIGNLMRLVGALFFGYLSDFSSRKKAVLYLSFVMAAATLSVGLMPKLFNEHITLMILFGLRTIQAVSFGGEIPCASTFAYESGANNQRCSRISHIFSGAAVGAVLATATLSFITFHMTAIEVANWGWRIPFILGGILGFLSFGLRKYMQDIYVSPNKNMAFGNVVHTLKDNAASITRSSLMLFTPAALICTNLYYSTYLPKYFHIDVKDVYFAQTISLIFSALFAPIVGRVSRMLDARKAYIFVLCAFLIAHTFLFQLIDSSLISFMILWQTFITSGIVLSMFLAIENLQIEIRATSMGLAYHLAFVITSFVPSFYVWVISYYPNPDILFYINICIGIISLLATWKKRGC